MEKFTGILFTLKKRSENVQENDNDYYKYLVMGYYDGLDINTVSNWTGMRPRTLKEFGLQVNLNAPFVDQYTIKAFFPENIRELEEKGFVYDLWENIGNKRSDRLTEKMEEVRRKNPYICLSVLNMAESFLHDDTSLSAVPEKLYDSLAAALGDTEDERRKFHCAVFPSIGYADYILLFLTDDLAGASEVLSQLRGEKRNGFPLVSGIYSVCGIDWAYVDVAVGNCPVGAKATVRINLREGISPGNFAAGLAEEVKSIDKTMGLIEEKESKEALQKLKVEIEGLKTELENNLYFTFGSADSMIIFERSLDVCVRLYLNGHIFNPGHPFYKKYISGLLTSVRIARTVGEDAYAEVSARQDISLYEEQFRNFIKKYEVFLKESSLPTRSLMGMQQIMKNYLNMAALPHGFDIRKVLGDAFSALMDAVDYFVSKKPFLPNNEEGDESDSGLLDEMVVGVHRLTVDAVNIFKETVGDMITDLMRSDRLFIEGNALIHPAIGSATKLLFAYTEILNEMAAVCDEQERFQFIVTSGGCDRTEAMDLFSFASPEDAEKIKKLIIITIPEMSLYDVQGTFFRILHEYGHFIGDRKRDIRYRYIVSALAKYIGENISFFEFSEESLRAYVACASNRCGDNTKEKISTLFEECFRQKKSEVSRKISDVFIRCERFYDRVDERCLHIDRMRTGLLNEEVFKAMLDEEGMGANKENRFSIKQQIYRILQNGHRELISSFCRLLKKLMLIPDIKAGPDVLRLEQAYRIFNLLFQCHDYQSAAKEADYDTKQLVDNYFEAFLSGHRVGQVKLDFSYTNIREELFRAMTECFSDCSAVGMLGIEAGDFLLTFIYEVWDIDRAFPVTIADCLRIGADLKVMYGIEGCLGDNVKQYLLGEGRRDEKSGEYAYKNVDEMIERIDYFLALYQEEVFSGIRTELEGYLREACDRKDDELAEKLGKIYRDCDFRAGAFSSDISSSINAILQKWRQLGVPEDESERYII